MFKAAERKMPAKNTGKKILILAEISLQGMINAGITHIKAVRNQEDSQQDMSFCTTNADGKGMYYKEKTCETDAVCRNDDDDLTLCLVKEL